MMEVIPINTNDPIAGDVPDIFRIDFLCIPQTNRQWLPGLPKQLIGFFVHAYDQDCRVIRYFVDVQVSSIQAMI